MANSGTLIRKPVRQMADIRTVLGTTGGAYALARSPQVNKWDRFKPFPSNALAIDQQAVTSHLVPFDMVQRNLVNSVGDMNIESSSIGGLSMEFWTMYGLKIPVLLNIESYNIAAAIDAMNANPDIYAWPRVLPTKGRMCDFNFYKHNILPPFYYECSNGYNDHGPSIVLGYNNSEDATYCVGLTYIMEVLGQTEFNKWKPCVIIKKNGAFEAYAASDTVIHGEFTQWTTGVLSGGTSSGLECKAYFCLRNTTDRKVMLFPYVSGYPNPVTFKNYNTADPQNDPFRWIFCDPYADGYEMYQHQSGTQLAISDVYDNYKGILTNGSFTLKVTFHNSATNFASFSRSLVSWYCEWLGTTKAFTCYDASGNLITGNIEVPANGTKVVFFEFGDMISSGEIDENSGGHMTFRYNGVDEFGTTIRMKYSSTGSGQIYTA